MDIILYIALLVFAFIVIPIGIIGFLLYFIPKKIGYPKLGKYLAIGFGVIATMFILADVFRDQLFTKKSARKLVAEQGIFLNDKFDLVQNKSMSNFSESFRTFTLIISDEDKHNAIETVKNSADFKGFGVPLKSLWHREARNRYRETEHTQNYKTESTFVREVVKPHGEKYTPTLIRIIIYKDENKLVFEAIN